MWRAEGERPVLLHHLPVRSVRSRQLGAGPQVHAGRSSFPDRLHVRRRGRSRGSPRDRPEAPHEPASQAARGWRHDPETLHVRRQEGVLARARAQRQRAGARHRARRALPRFGAAGARHVQPVQPAHRRRGHGAGRDRGGVGALLVVPADARRPAARAPARRAPPESPQVQRGLLPALGARLCVRPGRAEGLEQPGQEGAHRQRALPGFSPRVSVKIWPRCNIRPRRSRPTRSRTGRSPRRWRTCSRR